MLAFLDWLIGSLQVSQEKKLSSKEHSLSLDLFRWRIRSSALKNTYRTVSAQTCDLCNNVPQCLAQSQPLQGVRVGGWG